jgi:hypothetical protein
MLVYYNFVAMIANYLCDGYSGRCIKSLALVRGNAIDESPLLSDEVRGRLQCY